MDAFPIENLDNPLMEGPGERLGQRKHGSKSSPCCELELIGV
jgi:hypothetical protein